jgi:transcriptional regulator with XRE-family HTH domain
MHRWHTLEDLSSTEQLGARLLGAGVRRARLNAGWSQRQLAWQVGLSQSMISRLETGHLRGMRFRMLARVAGAVRLGPAWLVDGGPTAPTRRLPGEAQSG